MLGVNQPVTHHIASLYDGVWLLLSGLVVGA